MEGREKAIRDINKMIRKRLKELNMENYSWDISEIDDEVISYLLQMKSYLLRFE